MPVARYEIRVAGALPAEALLDYEGLTLAVERAETVLQGPLPDQAALQGLLARLEVFGAQVVLVRRLGDRPYRRRLPAPLTGAAYRRRLPAPLTGAGWRRRAADWVVWRS